MYAKVYNHHIFENRWKVMPLVCFSARNKKVVDYAQFGDAADDGGWTWYKGACVIKTVLWKWIMQYGNSWESICSEQKLVKAQYKSITFLYFNTFFPSPKSVLQKACGWNFLQRYSKAKLCTTIPVSASNIELASLKPGTCTCFVQQLSWNWEWFFDLWRQRLCSPDNCRGLNPFFGWICGWILFSSWLSCCFPFKDPQRHLICKSRSLPPHPPTPFWLEKSKFIFFF